MVYRRGLGIDGHLFHIYDEKRSLKAGGQSAHFAPPGFSTGGQNAPLPPGIRRLWCAGVRRELVFIDLPFGSYFDTFQVLIYLPFGPKLGVMG